MRIVLAIAVALLAAAPARADFCGYNVTLAFGKGCPLHAGNVVCLEQSAQTGPCDVAQTCMESSGCKYTLASKNGPSAACPSGSKPAKGLRCFAPPAAVPTAGEPPPRSDKVNVEVELTALCAKQGSGSLGTKSLSGTCTLTNKTASPNTMPEVTITAVFSGSGCSGGKNETASSIAPGDTTTVTAGGTLRSGTCTFACDAESATAQTLGQSSTTNRLAVASIPCPQ